MNENYMNKKNKQTFQMISLIAMTIIWIGYALALYHGNDQNISWYFGLIIILSLVNTDILFTKAKLANIVFTVLAKINGILFFIGAIYMIISLLIK